MQTILDYIRRSAGKYSGKVAVSVLHGGVALTYSELCAAMERGEPLPLPLLGAAWDGDFILHTSGTTGAPKDIPVTQRAVCVNTLNLIERQGYSAEHIFIIAGDMTHLGCWSKLFPVLATGGTIVIIPDGMKRIDDFYEALSAVPEPDGSPYAQGRKYATFLVPTQIGMLMQDERLALYADRIDFIETGAAPMSQTDMEHLCRLLPHSRLYNTYASTETGIIATYNYNDGAPESGCCGTPMPRCSVTIDEDGRIVCHSEAYDTPIVTNDRGYLDADGRLHILGRCDDIINVGGYKVSPEEVEEAARSHPDVADCICVGIPHSLLGSQLELRVVLRPGAALDKRSIARHIARLIERHKVPLVYKTVDAVPRNANGKILRERDV